MVMSSVEVRSHSVQLTGHEKATITASRSAEQTTPPSYQQPLTYNQSVSHTYSNTQVLLTQGQQEITSVQIAAKSLHLIGKSLTQIKAGLSEAYTKGADRVTGLHEMLSSQKKAIESVLQSAKFNGKNVVDNELRLQLKDTDTRRFSIPGLNVHRQADRAEQVRLDFPQGQAVVISFDGHSSPEKTLKMLDRSLIPMGMRASMSQEGNILFEVSADTFQHMQQNVMITGQGHRFPAGQANRVNIKPEPEGIGELRFDLSSKDGIKKSLSRVQQHLNQVQYSLSHARIFQQDLQLQVKQQPPKVSEVDLPDVLAHFTENTAKFTGAFQVLSAQANVKRQTVVALLQKG